MNIKTARWVWLVVSLQVAALLAWAGYHENIRSHAPTVRLKTLPVDPRDILRGDYMILNYEISRGKVAFDVEERPDVFVVLKPSGEHHVVQEILADEPSGEDPRTWVRASASGRNGNVDLNYGIERFFVPEGKGEPRFDKMVVEASVSADHRLYIRRVYLDGKRFP